MEFGNNLSVIEDCDDFEVIESQIADPQIMFTLLTKLYNDLTRIIVQEYIANARDAHREIGNDDRPIRITLPTRFTNELVMRDFGPGISPNRVANVFAHLGASTKRSNNKQTGGFGIGAKSAFCYVDSFNIETFIDGIKRSYTFLKAGEDGKPKILCLGEEPTEEENGTGIIIAIKGSDIDKVCSNVYKLTQFWEVRPEIVNPDTFNGQKYRDFTVIAEGRNYKFFQNCPDTYVVVDGIPYSFHYDACFNGAEDYDKYKAIFDTKCFNFFFSTGEVSISPNREGLSYDNETIVTVRKVVDEAIAEIKVNTQNSIDLIDNIIEAKSAISKFSTLSMFTKGLTWRGHDLSNFRLNSKFYRISEYRLYRQKLRKSQAYHMQIDADRTYIFCDEDEIHLNRVKTIHNSCYRGYYIIEMIEYSNNPHQTLEEFEAERDEYDASINIRSLNFKMITSFDKFVPEKRISIKGNIYKFNRNARSCRDAWTLLDVDYDEIDGYYVEWIRGEAVGFNTATLEILKHKYGIKIYGVATRHLKKLEDSDNLEHISKFIDMKVEEFREFIEDNKHTIYSKDLLRLNSREINFLECLGSDIVAILRDDVDCYEHINKLDIVKDHASKTFDEKKMREFKEFCDLASGRISREIVVPELDIDDLCGAILSKYPLLEQVNTKYNGPKSIEHAKMYVTMVMGNYKAHNPQGLTVLDTTELT